MTERLNKGDYFEDPHLPIQVHIRDPQPDFPLHAHGFDELVVILRGAAVHVVDDQPFPVRSGDVFVVSGTHEHQYRGMHGLALANVLFDKAALGMAHWDIRALPGFHALFELEPILRSQETFNSRLRLDERQLAHVTGQLRELQREAAGRIPGYRVMAGGIFMQLAVFLSRCYADMPAVQPLDLLRLGDAIATIETHFARKITQAELAAKAHLSTRHFQRVFHACLGRSPIDYLLHVRITRASELLLQTRRRITEIGFDCGFGDSNYFARQFRAHMGCTPGEYRKSLSGMAIRRKQGRAGYARRSVGSELKALY